MRKNNLITLRCHVLCCLAMATCGFVMAGCGPSGPETVPASGKITLDGGPWPKPGVLYFTPNRAASGLPSRPGKAQFDVDGNFTASTFSEGDGLIPGTYKVGVECWEVAPNMDSPIPSKSYVPFSYQSSTTSRLEVTVESGQRSAEIQLDIPTRQP